MTISAGVGSPPTTYSSGYSSAPGTSNSSQPYPTKHMHEPGDGYRYQLYYNPATGTYLYYPVTQ